MHVDNSDNFVLGSNQTRQDSASKAAKFDEELVPSVEEFLLPFEYQIMFLAPPMYKSGGHKRQDGG